MALPLPIFCGMIVCSVLAIMLKHNKKKVYSLKNIIKSMVNALFTMLFNIGIKKKILPYPNQGKLGGQNKFPRVMKGKRFAEWSAFVHRSLSQKRGF